MLKRKSQIPLSDKQRVLSLLRQAEGERKNAARIAGVKVDTIHKAVSRLRLWKQAKEISDHFEIVRLMNALAESKGNIVKAAGILGIRRMAVYEKIKALGIGERVKASINEIRDIAKSRKKAELLRLFLHAKKDIRRAARMTGISEEAMRGRLRKYGILDLTKSLGPSEQPSERALGRMAAKLRKRVEKPADFPASTWISLQTEIAGFIPKTESRPTAERILSTALNYWAATRQQLQQIISLKKEFLVAHPDRGGSKEYFQVVRGQFNQSKRTIATERETADWPSLDVHQAAEKTLEKEPLGSVVSIGKFTFIGTSLGPAIWHK